MILSAIPALIHLKFFDKIINQDKQKNMSEDNKNQEIYNTNEEILENYK